MKQEPLSGFWSKDIPRRSLRPDERPPRSRLARRIRATAIWLAIIGVPFVVGLAVGRTSATGDDLTSLVLAILIVATPYAVVGIAFGERVSLSWREVLFSRVNWIWRLAYLPYRDWPPLPAEVGRLERIDVKGDPLPVFRLK
ncbi:hypothetical protein Aple_025020 [Acrocarpospora pleiomorpha]|uniref:Uncharacterized protein n=1 Tax=Acrocarpospora pleiomorpha TaxID=90975 RepID=A0A5M3XG30_9ACTN|nr:hypothetical protein [Acrocarpospora pleiomorpha]GES19606.1 hypothetical protein Aple_025020 [Acrocarpospora pleiomorpha]